MLNKSLQEDARSNFNSLFQEVGMFLRRFKLPFWLADKVFVLHTATSLAGVGLAVECGQVGFAILLAGLWVGTLVIWFEWKNG